MTFITRRRRQNDSGWLYAPRYLADGAYPAVIADFRRGLFAITTVPLANIPTATNAELSVLRPATFSEVFAFTASSDTARWYTDSAGVLRNNLAVDQPRFDWSNGVRQLLLESASTNLLLNSAALSTQNVTVTAVAHTLSFYGTGSVTLSGTATGTLNGTGANSRVFLTFTPTAGTLTLTVSGSVTFAQLEALAYATTYIETAGATVTRAIENMRFSLLVEAIFQRSAFSSTVRAQLLANGINGGIIGTSTTRILIRDSVGGSAATRNDAGSFLSSNTGGANTSPRGYAVGLDAAGRSISYDGTAATSDANGLAGYTRTNVWLGRDVSPTYADGRYDEVAIYPFRASDTALRAQAVAYA